MPTGPIGAKKNFQVVEEVRIIHETMTVSGPNVEHERFVKLLLGPNNAQRQQIVQQYRTKYGGANLVDELKKKLPPSEVATNQLYQALLDNPAEHDAKFLKSAMKGLGTNEEAIIEVLVTRNNQQLRDIKAAYLQLFKSDLAKDIASETSGDFKKLLLDLLDANRDESLRTDPVQAKKDADALYKAGEKKLGTDEKVFINIFANQNLNQLALVFAEYQKLTNHTIEQAVKAEFSGDILNALLTICSHVRNGPAGEVAELLHKAIQNGGKDDMLIHLIVSHSEVDLNDIAQEYQKRFNVPLATAIQNAGTKSATLKNALMAMVKGNQ